jgi:hypothetical protein
MPDANGVWSKEEVDNAISEMVDADISEDDIDQFLVGIKARQPSGRFIWEQPASEQASRVTGQVASFAGPYLGGVYGAQAGAKLAGKLPLGGPGRILTQFGGEAAGIGLGDVAGQAANQALEGQPIRPDLVRAGKTGVGGAAVGSALRGMVQLGGALGHVPEAAIQGAAEPVKVGRVTLPLPNLKRIGRAGPHTVGQIKAGASPEADLVRRAAEASRKLESTITKQRLEKVAIIKQADAAGVRIPVSPIQDALREHIVNDPGAVTREARTLNARIQDTIDSLGKVSSQTGGTLSPGQVDALIRKQLRPRVYTSSGQPSHSMYAEPIASAESSATKLLNDALPGDIAAKNAEISRQLTEAEHAAKMFGYADKAGVSARIAEAFQPNNETSARALNVLAQHDPKLVDDAFDLYVRRKMAGDIRVPEMQGQAGFYGTFIGKPVELATRAAAPFQRLAGGAAAGAYRAKEQRNKDRRRVIKPTANP